jgi:hypothetical protein
LGAGFSIGISGGAIVAKPKITSREYKVLLHATQFQGDNAGLTQSAMAFWQDFRRAIGNIAPDTDGRLAIEERRLIRFHDTGDHCLRRNDYVFRERIDEVTGEREVTLKFRHPDRYLAASRDVTPASPRDARTKFEEDIKAPFQGLYSHSTTQRIGGNKNLNRLKDPCRLFPGLPKQLDHHDDDEAIAPVGALTVRELVLTGGHVQICDRRKVETECALIVWYDAAGDRNSPEVVEFSFRYGDDDEGYDGKAARRAYEIFQTLQAPALADWVDPTGTTKTGYAYEHV